MFTFMADSILRFLTDQPAAYAIIRGSEQYDQLKGLVTFYDFFDGTIVMADVTGLPDAEGSCGGNFFGFHIHDGGSCTGPADNPFQDSGMHYNPGDCSHPFHAGDMPVLEGNRGTAWCAFYTQRFKAGALRGKTVVIHDQPDDYRTQPSGNSGTKIACGVIE